MIRDSLGNIDTVTFTKSSSNLDIVVAEPLELDGEIIGSRIFRERQTTIYEDHVKGIFLTQLA